MGAETNYRIIPIWKSLCHRVLSGDQIGRFSDEQTFILSHDRRSRDLNLGFRAVIAQHFELESANDAVAGLHIHDDAVIIVHDPVVQLVRAGHESFDEFDPDTAAVLDGSERCESGF